MKFRSKQINLDAGATVTGSFLVTGSSEFDGKVTIQPYDTAVALVVSGAVEIVDGYIQNTIQSASLRIGALGTFGNPLDNKEIDLGGLF